MLDLSQLRKHIIRPALEAIDAHSPAAENLVLGTALVESGLRYVAQLNNGPARGLWQMEPATAEDIHRNYLAYRPKLRDQVKSLMFAGAGPEANLTGNLIYGAAMCRIHYLRVSEPLPFSDDARGMARYWKRYYNTALGDGDVDVATGYFEQVCR